MRRCAALIGMLVLGATMSVRAEDRVDEVDFDGAVIEGTVAAPAGATVEGRSPAMFESMIDERSSFRAEMADGLRADPVEKAPARAVRVAQAGTVDPCHDEIYLSLKKKELESLSDREFEIFKAKDQACNDARVRAVATPAPAPTAAPITQPAVVGGDLSTTPAPAPQPPPRRWGQPWGAKDLLLLMFGGVALLFLMLGGMLLLLTVLAA